MESLLIGQVSSNMNEDEVLETSRVIWAGVHGITLPTVDDKLFTSTPVDGKALIDNLLDTYLNKWKQ